MLTKLWIPERSCSHHTLPINMERSTHVLFMFYYCSTDRILGQRQPNKGGICIKLVLGMTSVCFVSCHLAAHEGRFAARNQSVAEILRGAHVGHPDCDLTQQFHHVFFFGDLNYRIDLSVAPTGGHIEPFVRDMVRIVLLPVFQSRCTLMWSVWKCADALIISMTM